MQSGNGPDESMREKGKAAMRQENTSETTGDRTASTGPEPVIAQYTSRTGEGVCNEVRGHVSGTVIQISGDHHGGIHLQ